jgi:hypothetical protein
VRCLLVLAVIAHAGGVASAQPAPAEPTPAVPASRRLSPRNDAVLASYSTTYNGELTTRDLRLKAAAPIFRGDGFGLALLVGYGATQLDVSLADLDPHLTLHRIESTIAGGGGLAPGWSLRGSLGAAYSSDLRDATWSALQITSSAMLHRVLGPSDGLLGGVVYTSSADLFPVLPIIGYVHQREGSPFRFDIFLPKHVRAEYELRPRLRGALGIEVVGNSWIVQVARSEVNARRAGGAVFGEIQLGATELVRLEARLGMSVDRYTLPAAMDGSLREQPLRAAAFAQLAVLVAP